MKLMTRILYASFFVLGVIGLINYVLAAVVDREVAWWWLLMSMFLGVWLYWTYDLLTREPLKLVTLKRNQQGAVDDFMRACGQEVKLAPALPSDDIRDLRIELMREELLGNGELIESMLKGDLVGIADGLADLLYVVHGTASAYGIDDEIAFQEAHRSNMTKVLPDGSVLRSETGKILKPESYTPADFSKVIRELTIYGRRNDGR